MTIYNRNNLPQLRDIDFSIRGYSRFLVIILLVKVVFFLVPGVLDDIKSIGEAEISWRQGSGATQGPS